MRASGKKVLMMVIGASLLTLIILGVLFCCTGSPPSRVVGDLTTKDVRNITRIVSQRRAGDYRSPHPYASASAVMRLLHRFRRATAKMELMKRPDVVPDMVYVVYRERFNTNHMYVYYFETDGTNGWKYSSSKESGL